MSNRAGYSFCIRPKAEGWSWTTLDAQGAVRARGLAPTRKVAAAFVIRAIAAELSPQMEVGS